MNLKYLLVFVGLIIGIKSYAYKEFQQGKIFLNNGDSILCLIRVYEPDVLVPIGKLQYKEDGIIKKIKFKEIAEVHFDHVKYKSINYTYTTTVYEVYEEEGEETVNLFAIEQVVGRSILYKTYYLNAYGKYILLNGYPSMGTDLTWTYYIRIGDEIERIDKLSFRNDCSKIYKDCPELLNKIKNKEFEYYNISKLVEYANSNCLD